MPSSFSSYWVPESLLPEGMPPNAYTPNPFRTRLPQENLSCFLCLQWPLYLASLPLCGLFTVGLCCSLTSLYVLLLWSQVVSVDFVPKARDVLYCLWYSLTLSTAGAPNWHQIRMLWLVYWITECFPSVPSPALTRTLGLWEAVSPWCLSML